MVSSRSTEMACGVVLANVDHGNAPVDAGQVGDDVFEIGELHIGNQEQIRGGTWYSEAQLIQISQTQRGAATVVDAQALIDGLAVGGKRHDGFPAYERIAKV